MYVSTVSAAMTKAEVEGLAERAASRNAQRDVTGMLAYNTQSFMQLLEGSGDDVLAIMSQIEADTRHTSITYIRQDDSRTQRECPDWSMCPIFVPLTGSGAANVFTGSLPAVMELDTKILFTSFASQLSASQAAANAEAQNAMRSAAAQPPANSG